ncbi:MAG: hypothetical protein HN341_01985 [Verrucomicrobia bacterium]|jgi:hypothetical protein|nr:hypothetical protein [Verrucomicrobiota bacterium]
MSFFEAGMLLCFGISWPISIAKSLRTKQVVGKSPLFMAILCVGYVSGCIHKALYSMDWIIGLYIMNLIMVSFDLFLYYRYLPKRD